MTKKEKKEPANFYNKIFFWNVAYNAEPALLMQRKMLVYEG